MCFSVAKAEEEAPPAEGGGEGVRLEEPFAKEWRDENGRLQKLKSQIEKQKADLKEMFESKGSIKTSEEATALSKEILKKTAELKTDYTEFRKIQLHLRFEHPEKGDFSDRKYEREDLSDPVKESNFNVGIQGKLDKLKANVEAHYSVTRKKALVSTSTEVARKPASVESSKRIILAK